MATCAQGQRRRSETAQRRAYSTEQLVSDKMGPQPSVRILRRLTAVASAGPRDHISTTAAWRIALHRCWIDPRAHRPEEVVWSTTRPLHLALVYNLQHLSSGS